MRLIFLLMFCTASCSLILNDSKLSDSDLDYIQKLGLLNDNEKLLLFSTSMNIKTSGNLITDYRIASYWVDKDESKSYKEFAYYSDIVNIESVDNTQAWTYSSYLLITRKDNSTFKLYIDGDKEKYRSFIKVANAKWGENK